jgi:succinate dehydrogenase / fumarate reductase cytochrome b subunit
MAPNAMEAAPRDADARSVYVSDKLASLLAFAPLGVWTVVHLWNNLAAFQGAEAWQSSVTSYQSPATLLITSLVVLIPLVLHTVWGVKRLTTSSVNYGRYRYFANIKYVLQRVSALGVLGFLGAHIWLAFLHPRIVERHPETFQDLAGQMHHHLPTLVVYLLGTLGVAYHLGNGLSGFLWSFGATASRKAVHRIERWGIGLFVLLLVMSWAAIYALWSAGGALPPPTAGS